MLNQNNMSSFWGKTISIAIAIIFIVTFIIAGTANAITREDAKNLVLNKILTNDIGKVDIYLWKNTINAKDSLRLLDKTLSCPYSSNWVFFIDDMPAANWCHPCRYIFVDTITGDYKIVKERIHPENYDPENYEHTLELVSGIPRPEKKSLPKIKKNNTAIKKTAATNSNLYAVIINGCDWGRYWNDISAIYCTLIDVYGFSKDNIFVHYVEGYSTQPNGDDLDGPDVPSDDIDYDAYKTTIERTFRNMSGEWTNDPNVPELGPQDQLFVFVDDHGDGDGNGHSWICLPGDDLHDYELSFYVKYINCAQMIYVMEQCYSGGFIDDLSNYYNVKCQNRVIHTACDYYESSYCEMHISAKKYNEFVFYWTSAARGYYPVIDEPWQISDYAAGSFPFDDYSTMENHPPDYNPDTDGDGIVQMQEAFDYANNWDTWSRYGYFYRYPGYIYIEYPKPHHNICFQEDLLSLGGLSGVVENSQLVNGNFLFSGDLTIENNVTLSVSSGSSFNFLANQDDQNSGSNVSKCELIVHGELVADDVIFTSTGSNSGDWYGILFDNTIYSSYIQLSTIEYATYGVYCDNTYLSVQWTNIQYNSGNGIRCHESSPTIYHNNIESNGIGVFCQLNSHPYINDNYIRNNNSYGIYCTQTCNPHLRHNEISNNNGGGIACLNSSSPQLTGKNESEPYGANKVISNSGNGVLAMTASNPNLGFSLSYPLAGYNDIYSNTAKQVGNYTDCFIYAYKNWWGTPNPGTELFSGPVGYSHQLTSPSPYAGPTWGSLAKLSLLLAQENINELEEYLENGQLLEGAGKFEEAISAYRYVVDNYGDTEYGPFALSRLMACRVKQGDITVEKNYMSTIPQKYVQSEVVTTALLWQPLIEVRSGNNQLALKMCDSLVSTYAGTDLARDAFFEKGTIQLYELNDIEAAKKIFEEFTLAYPKDALLEHILIILDNYQPSESSLPKVQPKNRNISSAMPTNFHLSQNFPNPFNPETEIHYQLPEDSHVKIVIFNLMGQKICTLVNKRQPTGFYSVRWNGRDENGVIAASGVYFYQLRADKFKEVKKMLLLR